MLNACTLCTDHPSLVCHHSLSTIIDEISNVDMPFNIALGSTLCLIAASLLHMLASQTLSGVQKYSLYAGSRLLLT